VYPLEVKHWLAKHRFPPSEGWREPMGSESTIFRTRLNHLWPDPALTFHTPLGIVRSTLASQPRRFELCLRALYKFS
jgi:hypothetical protein